MNKSNILGEYEIADACLRGYRFVGKSQKKDGSFESFTSDNVDFLHAQKHHSIFPSSLILGALYLGHDFPLAHEIASKIVNYLLLQKSEWDSFNYWDRKSKEAQEMPYPDDLDDTFCAWAGIFLHDQTLVDGRALAQLVSILTFTEEKEGGPYRTWIVPENVSNSWKDIDLAVNCNVAYFLSLQEIYLKNINHLVEKALEKSTYFSPYYATPFAVTYFITRFYRGKNKKLIREFLLNESVEGVWNKNPLDSALAVTALLRSGYSPTKLGKSIEYVLSMQKSDGSWDAFPFVMELEKDGEKKYAGSAVLTTAFCLESLNEYANCLQKRVSKKSKADYSSKQLEKELFIEIEKGVYGRFSFLGESMHNSAKEILHEVLHGSMGKKIALLSYYFAQVLEQKKKQEIKNSLFIQLGMATVFGWTAYKIYDDFLDDDGEISHLPIANVCVRESWRIFLSMFVDQKMQRFFPEIFDAIEAANFREVTNYRIKIKKDLYEIPEKAIGYENYTMLADRSIGFALGPMIILWLVSNGDKKKVKNLRTFFENYIIARQLNDDLHDWESDFKKGHVSSVVALVLEKYKEKHGIKGSCELKYEACIAEFKRIVWEDVVADVCGEIIDCCKRGRIVLKRLHFKNIDAFANELLCSIEESAQKTIREQKAAMEFLSTYGKTKN